MIAVKSALYSAESTINLSSNVHKNLSDYMLGKLLNLILKEALKLPYLQQ